MTRNLIRKYGPRVAVGTGALVPLFSFAALDPAIATAITAAQGDLLAVVALLVAAGVALWAASAVYRRFFKV